MLCKNRLEKLLLSNGWTKDTLNQRVVYYRPKGKGSFYYPFLYETLDDILMDLNARNANALYAELKADLGLVNDL
jgi:hypothetical protein